MHPLDIAEDQFRPEPTRKGRTVVCVDVLTQSDFDERIGRILDRLGLQQESHGLTFDGCAVTFTTPEQAAIFRMFYDGDTKHAR